MYILKAYLVSLFSFLAVDAIWLTKIAPSFYKKHIGHLMAEKPNLVAALIFYLFYISGALFFAILPGLRENNIKTVIINGAFLGALTYATYDLTNLATLKDWPVLVTVVDIIWGAVLTATTAAISYLIMNKIK